MKEELLYTPEEIAQKLKLSKYTVYEMIKKGEIPDHRIGRSLRVSDSQFRLYLQESKMSENEYSVEILEIEGLTYAQVQGASIELLISVSTDLKGEAKIRIKPEDIIISREKLICSARNMLDGTVTEIKDDGNSMKITVDIGVPMTSAITKQSINEMNIKVGDKVVAGFKSLSVAVV